MSAISVIIGHDKNNAGRPFSEPHDDAVDDGLLEQALLTAQRTHDDVPLPSLGLVAGGNHHLAVRRCTNVASGLTVGRHTDRIRTVRIGTAHRVLHAVQQRVIIARYDATRSQKPEELTGQPAQYAHLDSGRIWNSSTIIWRTHLHHRSRSAPQGLWKGHGLLQ